ncbi:hypothetical protein [Halomonas sp. LBP4]|uniref:hypothetical protein n=1 Tax=Halomonas sp. LBP4 TaxID=2044917 RepID=UPI0011B6F188|nr:hypothetical protein [Halomonas sp. LBP4]
MACIIEFIGKPGSGKTRACIDLLRDIPVLCPDSRVKGLLSNNNSVFKPYVKAVVLFYSIGFQYSRISFIFHHLVEALSGVSRRRMISSLVNAIYLDFRLRCAVRHHDVVMLDQGFLQLCWANLDRNNEEMIKSVLVSLYGPYVEHKLFLVHIEASREVFEVGLKSRLDLTDDTGYRFKYLDEGEVKHLIEVFLCNERCCYIELCNDVTGRVDVEPIMSRMNDYYSVCE